MRSPSVVFLLAAAAAVAAQTCDYGQGHTCINPDASASVALPIPTLFASSSPSPSFVFAVDDLAQADIIAITAANKDVQVPGASANGPLQAVSWWLEFGSASANVSGSQERAYTAWALESNATSDIGGADGGCEGLLGRDCVADLKTLFTDKNTLQMGATTVGGALMKFFATPPRNLRCASIYWGDGSGRDLSLYGTSDTRPLVANCKLLAAWINTARRGKVFRCSFANADDGNRSGMDRAPLGYVCDARSTSVGQRVAHARPHDHEVPLARGAKETRRRRLFARLPGRRTRGARREHAQHGVSANCQGGQGKWRWRRRGRQGRQRQRCWKAATWRNFPRFHSNDVVTCRMRDANMNRSCIKKVYLQ